MLHRLRPWHWVSIALVSLVGMLLLWFALAYGGLPRLWSHHEHKKMNPQDKMLSYTAQDIPGDPINLQLKGARSTIDCVFKRDGWHQADGISARSALGIAASVVFKRSYPNAPVSPLYFADEMQNMAFQKDIGTSADKRHHVRFWQQNPNEWVAAASFDRGVGLSLYTLQITHHIGPDVDGERDALGEMLVGGGAKILGWRLSGVAPGWQRNGGGDKYFSDGRILVLDLADVAC